MRQKRAEPQPACVRPGKSLQDASFVQPVTSACGAQGQLPQGVCPVVGRARPLILSSGTVQHPPSRAGRRVASGAQPPGDVLGYSGSCVVHQTGLTPSLFTLRGASLEGHMSATLG